MKRSTLLLPLLLAFSALHAQNIGINANGAAPNLSAMLDIDVSAIAGTKRGLLIPRMTSAQRIAIPAPATGLLVFDQTFNQFWYFDGVVWMPFVSGNPGWTILGNSGTNIATNFLGTTDNMDFALRTNNIERMRVLAANGRVGIGVIPVLAQLEVNSGGIFDAIAGHSTNVGGYLGRETNITFGTPLQTLQGAGVYASNPAAGYTSTFAQSTGAANVAAAIAFSSVWIAQYNYVENAASSVFNPPGTYSQLNNSSTTLGGFQSAYQGYSNKGTVAGNAGYTVGDNETANAQNQDAIGVIGSAYSSSAFTHAGGYFQGFDYPGVVGAYAYVGGTTNGNITLRKITGTGSVAEIVPTPGHGRVTLIAPESPEYWYQDYGTVHLQNGHAHVDLDPILADVIMVDDQNPIRVFCSPVDLPMFNGITVTNRTATGFDLVEINAGTHSGTIDYQLVAKPKTNFGEGRFPQAPGPVWLKPDQEPASAKAANQPQAGHVFHWPADWNAYGYDVDKLIPIGQRVPAGPHAGKFKVAEGVFMDHIPAQSPEAKR